MVIKKSNCLLCRLRVGRSFLKSHGFSVNLSLTDKCLCGAVDDNKHFCFFVFFFQPERSEMLKKIECYVPNFSCLSIAKQCEILLYGINLNNQLPDPRNRIITLTVQKFITKTNRFSSHYE